MRHSKTPDGELCLLGGIYSDQKCSECGSKYVDDGRKGLFCPNHPDKWATRFRVKFQGVYKRFDSYKEAQRFLTGLRFQHDQGVFDVRDWKREHPWASKRLPGNGSKVKKGEIKAHTWGVYKYWMGLAIAAWEQTNIKEIGYAEIEDFLLARKVSGKTRANMRSCLHTFWTWLRKHCAFLPFTKCQNSQRYDTSLVSVRPLTNPPSRRLSRRSNAVTFI